MNTATTTPTVFEDLAKAHPLAAAVIKQLCCNDLASTLQVMYDIQNNGAEGGYPGFTYTKDTVKFVKDNRKAIAAMIEEVAEIRGEEVINTVRGLGALQGWLVPLKSQAIAYALWNSPDGEEDQDIVDQTDQIENTFACIALEEVATAIVDN